MFTKWRQERCLIAKHTFYSVVLSHCEITLYGSLKRIIEGSLKNHFPACVGSSNFLELIEGSKNNFSPNLLKKLRFYVIKNHNVQYRLESTTVLYNFWGTLLFLFLFCVCVCVCVLFFFCLFCLFVCMLLFVCFVLFLFFFAL